VPAHPGSSRQNPEVCKMAATAETVAAAAAAAK